MKGIIGLILTMVVIVMGIFNGGHLINFVDVPSVIVVLFITIGSLLIAHVSIPTMLKAVLSAQLTVEELRHAARGWGRAKTYIIGAGWIGFLVGIMNIAQFPKLSDQVDALGPGIATATVTLFYAIVWAYAVFLPLQSRLEARIEKQSRQ